MEEVSVQIEAKQSQTYLKCSGGSPEWGLQHPGLPQAALLTGQSTTFLFGQIMCSALLEATGEPRDGSSHPMSTAMTPWALVLFRNCKWNSRVNLGTQAFKEGCDVHPRAACLTVKPQSTQRQTLSSFTLAATRWSLITIYFRKIQVHTSFK